MKITGLKYIELLIDLEPAIKKAGDLSIGLRQTAKIHNKYQTGSHMLDIVTEADFAVQEAILSEIAKTELVECELIAEEDTPSVKKFKGTNGFVLTLDPIDGTFIYASEGRFYSIIVGLNDKKDPLYTFYHYPTVSWSRRIANNQVVDFGIKPEVKLKGSNFQKSISYSFGEPKDMIPNKIFSQLISDGYVFTKRADITDESGSTTLLFLDQVAGYYIGNPGAYDGLGALHYAKEKHFRIYSDIDISKPLDSGHGMYYPGWYVVLRQ